MGDAVLGKNHNTTVFKWKNNKWNSVFSCSLSTVNCVIAGIRPLRTSPLTVSQCSTQLHVNTECKRGMTQQYNVQFTVQLAK